MANLQQFPKFTIGSGDGTGNLATINSLGELLVNVGGSGGTTSVNIAEINGAAPSPSNALPVSLGSGSGVIGTVDIDQTTPGVTNGVYETGALAGEDLSFTQSSVK